MASPPFSGTLIGEYLYRYIHPYLYPWLSVIPQRWLAYPRLTLSVFLIGRLTARTHSPAGLAGGSRSLVLCVEESCSSLYYHSGASISASPLSRLFRLPLFPREAGGLPWGGRGSPSISTRGIATLARPPLVTLAFPRAEAIILPYARLSPQ